MAAGVPSGHPSVGAFCSHTGSIVVVVVGGTVEVVLVVGGTLVAVVVVGGLWALTEGPPDEHAAKVAQRATRVTPTSTLCTILRRLASASVTVLYGTSRHNRRTGTGHATAVTVSKRSTPQVGKSGAERVDPFRRRPPVRQGNASLTSP